MEALREGWKQYLTDPALANAVMAKLDPEMDGNTFEAAADAQKQLMVDESGSPALGGITSSQWAELGK